MKESAAHGTLHDIWGMAITGGSQYVVLYVSVTLSGVEGSVAIPETII